jgi:heme/copper-type cytochrome/quinol oxidase subunit 4
MPASDHSHHDTSSPQGSFWMSRTFFVWLAFLTIAVFLLVSEHRAHVLGAWPFLLLLACPLLHVFMHGGHRSHSGSAQSVRDPKEDRS